ncbi:MAG: PAS domain S-box protein [Ferruginibacter sp.]|nr:PAS domain S-box protein [Ferruginibacter sp.]
MLLDTAINILMIEDNTGDQFLLSELLKASDINVKNLFSAVRLDNALDRLKEEPIDIILLDLSLPDSSGIQTFHTLINHAGKSPVVILSGLTDTRIALDAITLGAQDYLIKGDFDEKLLAKTIRYSIERKKNTEALQESIERYNLVSKATNDMVWDWNIITGDVYRNVESWNKIFEGSLKELDPTVQFFVERIHPDDVVQTLKKVDTILTNPHQFIFEVECRVRKENGKYAYITDLGYIIRDEEGKPTRVIGATQNITARKEAEAIVKSSEERYRYLFNNNPACILIWNLDDFSILEVNDSSIEQYNYTKEEFLKKTVLEIQVPEELQEIKELAQKAKADVFFKVTAIGKHINKAGEYMFMDITSHRIEYKGHAVILALANNVTEKILLEEKLENEHIKKQQEITEAVITAQEKERQGIGAELHDNVNQILASSRLYLGLAKRDIPQPNQFLDETEILITSAIAEIRSLSHSLIPPSLDDSEMAEALDNIIATLTKTGSIKVIADLKRFNENSTSDKLKLGIYRMVQEQFNNILKYSKASIVHISLAHEGGKILLKIKDNGIGFDKLKKTPGVGLLNIKTRASLFNGLVNVITSPGNGCELVVSFN